MVTWLYQMAMGRFSPEIYRESVWEGETAFGWPTFKIQSQKGERPSIGDRVVFWFVKGSKEPGVYGWGVILKYKPRSQCIDFRPVHPSDYLMMHPLYNEEVERLIDEIRGPFAQATMWPIEEQHAKLIREKIREWIR